jgi:MFS family permease
MFTTANNAMIADLTAPQERARAYSLSRVAVSSGMVVGPLCGSLLLRLGAGFRTLFAGGSALCLAFLVFSLLTFTETKPAPLPSAHSRSAWAGYRLVLSDRRFLSLCAVTLLPLYGFGQLWVTFPIALHERLGLSAASWGLLITLYALAIVLLQYPLVRRLERYDKTTLMAAGSAFVGVGMGGAALLMRSWPIVVFMLLVSLGVMLLIPISAAAVSEMAPASLRGRYMGAWTLAWTAGTALGPTVGGPVMDLLGIRGAYLLVLACGLAGGGLFLVRGRWLAAPVLVPPSS